MWLRFDIGREVVAGYSLARLGQAKLGLAWASQAKRWLGLTKLGLEKKQAIALRAIACFLEDRQYLISDPLRHQQQRQRLRLLL